MNDELFDYSNTGEAWVDFTQCARAYFTRLLHKISKKDPDILDRAQMMKHKNYCARLMYIMSFFMDNEDEKNEFDLDWAMVLARPSSIPEAKKALKELMKVGLIKSIKRNDGPSEEYPDSEFDWK